jgi:putative DNA primase/helicase
MAKRPNIPFKEIADAALNSIDTLLSRWLPGGNVQSGEYKVRNPLRADDKVGSFSINMRSGKWGDFATNDAGLDLIGLYAYLEGIKMNEAAIEVADLIGYPLPDECRPKTKPIADKTKPIIDPATVKEKKPAKETPWVPIYPLPTPPNAEPPQAHPLRGLPEAKWNYKNADGKSIGWVYRFKTSDGGKETQPLNYCKHKEIADKRDWRWMQWPEPNRPMYGLDRLAAKPDAYVLLVEGEKCADAGQAMIKGACVSWPGGSKAVSKVDFSPLAGRKIYAWADCDAQREKLTKAEADAGIDPESKPLLPEHLQSGMKAMLQIRDIVMAIDPATEFYFVDIPAPLAKPSGWDCADAVAEGYEADSFNKFILKTRDPLASVVAETAENAKSISTPNSATAQEVQPAAEEQPSWQRYMLRKGEMLVPCLSNVVDILEKDEKWQGVVAYDEFSQRAVKLKRPPYWDDKGEVGEWNEVDDSLTAIWITKIYRFSPSQSMVREAIEVVSRNILVNPPKDYMESLVWDGQKRVDKWMLDFLGVELNQYTMRVARWFFMGMVKRIYEPGCQFDYCLVLDGAQGLKKSSALAIIGGEWFGNTDLDLNNKDSMSAIRGKMLYEFSELGALTKSDATKQKSFLTRRIDEFRGAYGKREIRCLRTVLFCGTTNEWEWNKDPTGGRRWWPCTVKKQVDAEGLAAVRDQLFAEAVVMVKAGLRYWPNAEEQKTLFDPEQLKRAVQESYVDALFEPVANHVGEFSLHYAATEMLKMDVSKVTRDIQTRIGIALRQLGCSRIEKRNNDVSRYWYMPPEGLRKPTKIDGLDGGDSDEIPF